MALISSTGKIVMILTPVCGRWGIHKLMAKLSSNEFKVNWSATEEITIVTFNRKRTSCKILHADITGVDCTTRILNQGRFKIMLDENLIPRTMTREQLERLLLDGTISGEYQHAITANLLKK